MSDSADSLVLQLTITAPLILLNYMITTLLSHV